MLIIYFNHVNSCFIVCIMFVSANSKAEINITVHFANNIDF